MKMANSSFWQALWKRYSKSPSIALCRVPELEFAASLPVQGNFLDHCCGDGYFANLAWGRQKIFAGCDMAEMSIASAKKIGIYGRLDVCDASKGLPYESGTMDVVFNNSALEHIYDLDAALLEISRTLKTGGKFAFNVLNHRYFEWWPLDEKSKQSYREWQPFYHALSIDEWMNHLAQAGLKVVNVKGYFGHEAARQLARLDYWFSGYYIRGLSFQYVKLYLKFSFLASSMLKHRLETLDWAAEPDGGAGYFIQAVKQP